MEPPRPTCNELLTALQASTNDEAPSCRENDLGAFSSYYCRAA